jgi:hypothetical protein
MTNHFEARPEVERLDPSRFERVEVNALHLQQFPPHGSHGNLFVSGLRFSFCA